jgi:CRP/FNR family transcriptional regulator, cyclic AMP receptor protein
MSLFSKIPREIAAQIRILEKISLFSTLTNRELLSVHQILHARRYVAEEVIFDEGEEGLGMYVILEGQVKVTRKGMIINKALATLGPGETFGDMALIDGANRSGSAVALVPSRLLGFFRPDFLHLLQTEHAIGAKLSFQLAKLAVQRLRFTMNGDSIPAHVSQ